MTTLVGGVRGKPEGWLGNAAVGTIFGVEWRRVLDLEFKDTAPLGNNPMNEDKPVRIARCAPWTLGLQLLQKLLLFAPRMQLHASVGHELLSHQRCQA